MSLHFRWTHPPFRISQAPPMRQTDILSNIPKIFPQGYGLGVYRWANDISDRMHSILIDGISEERQAVHYLLLLKPVKESLIHKTERGENL